MVAQGRDTEAHVKGSDLRGLLEDSRRQRFIIRRVDESVLIDITLLAALIIAVVAPQLIALVVIGLLVEKITVSVEKVETDKEKKE
jgi:hypothetical protein